MWEEVEEHQQRVILTLSARKTACILERPLRVAASFSSLPLQAFVNLCRGSRSTGVSGGSGRREGVGRGGTSSSSEWTPSYNKGRRRGDKEDHTRGGDKKIKKERGGVGGGGDG